MDVATGAISNLLPKLGELLKEEYKLQKGVRGEIMFLKAELDSMQTALRKVSEAPIDQPPDIQVKLWARDVKELSYDVEDTIDAFMVHIGTCAPKKLHGLKDFINRSLNLLTKAKVRHKIGTDIKDIKSRITMVRERRDNYKVDIVVANPAGQTIDSLRLSALYKKATELVGTGDKSDGLIKSLMEGDEASKQQLKIVSIFGFGGLGKTTLANVAYQKLKVQFDCSAFISVSHNPNMKMIFKNMLHQLGKHSNNDDQAQLINELRKFLQKRRYFVVIDDIWNNPVWEQIKYALIENECGSRIITTTRSLDVAKHVGGVYQLQPLSPVDSRKLFYQRIFGDEDECPRNQLAGVSERILKKCGGVPLAIITIASLLASKKEKENTQEYWSKVCQSIGSGLEDNLEVNNMRRILSISYYDLPPHLKTCLLYLSLYPEDSVILAEDVIWKWIGEGFVHNKQGKRLHEVGEDYLDELINKSLIQPVDITMDNKADTCRVHDMVLDLITSLSNEEHFLTTLGGQQPMTVPTKIRRLSLQTSSEDDVKQLSTMSLSHVRSLTMFKKTNVHHKIGNDINDMKIRTTELRQRHNRYTVDIVVAKPVGPTIDRLRLSALYKKATELVGKGEKSDGLIKSMMEGDEASKQQLKIVSIVGIAGIGKTTLANVVYQKLKVQFDCGAFISVSQNPNMKMIFKNMLHQLGKHNNIDDQAQLINELREFLQNKRYFVVIDDIWDTSAWEQIKYALIKNKCGSRIITTTRLFFVAKHIGGVYLLEPLSPVDSRKLFYQRIFGDEDECPRNQLAEVSERILKKCGGVPLVIITIASLLASKKEKENVCRFICYELDDSLDWNNIGRILTICYNDLPPHLKTCLLYLSLYPEDSEINAEDLIRKWIGEGIVHNEQGKRLQEVGEDYLYELINKSFIQPVYITRDNKTVICRVHDMVLDLITSLSNEEHFLTTLGGQQPVTVPTKIRRLSLQTSNEDDVKQLSTMSLSHVRSLTMFEKKAFSLLPALSSFPVLRALDLDSSYRVENHHCKDICNLFHLRYLNLRGTSITEIPKEIENLLSLQVLDISGTEIKELPSTFVQLRQLVYLHVDWLTRLPDGFGNLKCLQELLGIKIRSPTMLHDLGGLIELRRLVITLDKWDKRYEEPFLQCLSNLVSLEILVMSNYCGGLGSRCGPQLLRSVDISDSTIHTVPRWMSSLSSLSYLHITLETLGVEDLQVLGDIPSLGDLSLRVVNPTEGGDERLIIGSGYPFRCLRKLVIWSDTVEVVFAQGVMQKLQTLEFSFRVRKAMDFDFGLENLSSLKHASVVMRCDGAEPWDVWVAEAAIRRALYMNPNNPTLKMGMSQEHKDMYDSEEDVLEDMDE